MTANRDSPRQRAAADFPFPWQRVKACPVYLELTVWGEFGFRRKDDADEDDRGGHTAYEVWHWPTNSVESDWFTMSDAIREGAPALRRDEVARCPLIRAPFFSTERLRRLVMARVKVVYTFEFNPEEISILLKLTGRESPDSIRALGLDVDAFEGLYSTFSEAAYAPMREDAP